MKKSNKTIRLCVAAALAGGSAGALASGFALIEQNASGLGNAYAGQAAAAENASTVYFNPAGMTRLEGTQVSGAINLIKPSAKFENTGSAPPGGRPLGDNGGDAGDWAFVPNAYLSWQLNRSLWLGVGLSVPFGLKTDYEPTWIGRFQAIKTEMKTYDINPSIAWKVNDWFSVGAGVSYQHAEVKLNRAVSFVASEGSLALDIKDNQWGYNVGAMFNPGPNTRIGLAYRSSMGYTLTGTAAVAGAVNAAPTVAANIRLPDNYSAGFAHALSDRWELLGDFTYTRWSTVKAIPLVTTSASALGAANTTLDTINFQFKDTYRVGLGTNFKWTPDFTLKLGVAYDKAPVDDAFRTVSLPDSDRTWLAVGGKYRVGKAGAFDFGYAHLFVKNGTINSLQGTAAAPFQKGNVVGNYENSVDILSFQYTHSF